LKNFIFITAFLIFQPYDGSSQILRQPVSALYPGSGSYSTQQNDVFSYLNNQASLAEMKNVAVGIYGETRFLLAASTLYTSAVAIPTKNGNFAMSIIYTGFKNFSESEIGLAYARKLGNKVDIGVQFNYYQYSVPLYAGGTAVNFEIGTIVHLTDKLNVGMHVYNPVGGDFGKTDEKLTATYSVGVGYDMSENFFVSTEIIKEENFPMSINAGLQYHFMRQFFVRAGVATATSTWYAGVGISWSKLRLDITGSYHPQLGISPGLLLIVNFAPPAASPTND
jgi:hypothetical protein